jgi:pimeloyl-ACP methyl ester carboxylesterase
MPALLAPLAHMLDLRWVPGRLVEAALLGSAAGSDLKETLHRVLATLPRGVIRTRVSEVLRVDKRDRLRAISCPILCLRARFDRLVSRKCLDEIASLCPHCEVRIFDAPHMLLESCPLEAAAAIDGFCERCA